MKKSLFILTLLLPLSTFPGCITRPPAPARTQLQVREFETREFEVHNSRRVMKSLLNVLQDEGFIVKNAVVELGLITATRSVDLEDSNDAFFRSLFMGDQAVWQKNAEIEVSINCSEVRDGTRVRANFQRKILDNRGGIMRVENVDDAIFYQDFFSKVDKGLFLERERL